MGVSLNMSDSGKIGS